MKYLIILRRIYLYEIRANTINGSGNKYKVIIPYNELWWLSSTINYWITSRSVPKKEQLTVVYDWRTGQPE